MNKKMKEIDMSTEHIDPIDTPLSVQPVVIRLSWPQIRDRMKAGEPLRWLPINDTPGQKRAVFIGSDRLDNDSSLEVHRAEARGELLVQSSTVSHDGFIESYVGTLRKIV